MLSSHSTGFAVVDARDDFARARRSRHAARVLRWIGRRRCCPDLPRALPDSAARPARIRGRRVIALEAIVGTVEPSPHFDERFRPASSHLRGRWVDVALAYRRGLPMPPITVREGPDGFYVVDGRHRVSVALAMGQRDIEAWVT